MARMSWFSRRTEQESTPEPAPNSVRMTVFVHGMVQGVGFRWWTRGRAMEIGLVGSARNLFDGRVEVVTEGSREDCERLLADLRGARVPGSVDAVVEQWSDARGGFRGFEVS
jgi:acylphosphatase